METNESVLQKNVVALGEQKIVGTIASVIVDKEMRSVKQFVLDVKNPTSLTPKKRVLPFEKIINIGDTFAVIQSVNDLLVEGSLDEERSLNGYLLVDAHVYTKAGNDCGKVVSYNFENIFGKITEIILSSEKTFEASEYMFFADDFVFIDDGEELSIEVRQRELQKEAAESGKQEVAAGEAKDEQGLSDDEKNILNLLEGLTLAEEVKSADGEVTLEEGTTLTKDILVEASKHNMLMALTMAAE